VCGCQSGKTKCSGICTDTSDDSSNCGNCGVHCSEGQICQSGECACPSGTTECESGCCPANQNNSVVQNQSATNPLGDTCFLGGIVNFFVGIWNWVVRTVAGFLSISSA
jgi:hypothetical protein